MNPRLLALRIIHEVLEDGKSLNSLAIKINSNTLSVEDRALCRQLVYGSVRWYEKLDFILSRLLTKPMKAKDSDVYCLLLLGIYQILYTRIPDHAAVNETVKLAVKLKKPWARNFANAILRNLLRQRERLEADADNDETAMYSHPSWLINIIKADWPDEWQQVLQSNNAQGKMTLRVNPRKLSRSNFLQALKEMNIKAEETSFSQHGVLLEKAVDVQSVYGFQQGVCSVQDEAAQLAADLLNIESGMSILDACAAPGGKTAAILEQHDNIQVTALDVDEMRLDRIRETLNRIELSAELKVADAGELQTWWDGNAFDRILLDAPCSGTGVIRRNPDIKIHRNPDDIERLISKQKELLQQLWKTLKCGGVLLYATCSIVKNENDRQVSEFIASQDDAELLPIEAKWGRQLSCGRQILPGEHDMDGFFYARIRKLEREA